MPRTAITITDTSRAGVNQPAQVNGDVANNHSFENNGRAILELASSTGTVNYTILIPGNIDGQAVTSRTYAVTATPVIAGPFPTSVYNQPDNTVSLNVDSANARIRVYRLP